MIRRYNRSQTLKAVCAFLLGLGSLATTYFLFWIVVRDVSGPLQVQLSAAAHHLIVSMGLLAGCVSAWRRWRDRKELGASREETELFRGRPFFYLLGRLFHTGPEQLLEAYALWKSRLRSNPDLDRNLKNTYTTLKRADRWQTFSDHPGRLTEIGILVEMGFLEYSTLGDEPRFKAR